MSDKPIIPNPSAPLPAKPMGQPLSVPAVEFEVDTAPAIRQGFWILLVGFGSFLLWAALAPLDEGVPTEGQVSLESKNNVIQHLNGGIVDQLLVKEGQFVKKNALLLTLNDASTRARYEEIRQHYLGMRSNENRLLSEKTGKASIQFHPDLLAVSKEAAIQAKMHDQQQLLQARQRLLSADMRQLQEAMQAEQASIAGNRQLISHKQNELSLLQQQMQNMREAVEEGYVPKTQYAELEQRQSQLSGDIAQITANMNKSQQVILEYQSRMSARKQTENKEIEEQLSHIRLEVDADQQKVQALQEELGRTELRAPEDGQVIGLQIHAAGAVIQPGQKLMNIVPVNGKLLLDAKIPPQLIDRVSAGQDADVRFSSFAHSPQLLVEGKVVSVSTDLISDPAARMDAARYYFLARIEVTDQGMKTLGARVLKPGMPVQIVIKTGERSFLTYLLHPLIKRLSASLKEE